MNSLAIQTEQRTIRDDRAAAARPFVTEPVPWRLSPRAIAWRLFLTCWVVYSLHFATDISREHYLAFAIGDHFSFRVDEYHGLHPDLFEKPGYGWHIGNNPGVSMFAAIPYAVSRPIIEPISRRLLQQRVASGQTAPPVYDSPRPKAREFFAEAWRRGLDIKLGLGALVIQLLFTAPISALAVTFLFSVLRLVVRSDRTALWLSVLFAFGTPVFLRTGYVNHNLILGFIAFAGLVTMWNPGASRRWSTRTRYLLAGLAGGTTVLFDYSGVVFLLGLFTYGLVKRWRGAPDRSGRTGHVVTHGAWYVLGSVPPILLLWFYQWRSFGNPFLPGQNWMPPVEWIDRGYKGYGAPQAELLWSLAFDHRYGLFVTTPLLLLALASPWVNRGARQLLPALEQWTMLGLFVALWVFFSGNNYTRLQWTFGIRYMTPIAIFLFIPASLVLIRLRVRLAYLITVSSVLVAWAMAMHRLMRDPYGVLQPLLRLFAGGFALPALTTLEQTGEFRQFMPHGANPLPLFLLTAALLYALWAPHFDARVGTRHPAA
jgi:hypothetical protein